jgi:hypothetical protein
MQGWGSKLDGATVRIAGLLHLAATVDGSADVPIEGPTMGAAIEIASYLIAHARATFDHMGTDRHLDAAVRVLGWLQRRGREEFSKRDAHAAHQSFIRQAADLDPVLRLLEDHGFIRALPPETRPQGGRPSQRFAVHPSLQNRTEPTKPTGIRGSARSVGSVGQVGSNGSALRPADPRVVQDEAWLNAPLPDLPQWDA